VLFEHAGDQEATLGRCHLSHMQRINDVKVGLDGLRRLAVGELEHAQRGQPSNRITITEMGSQRLDRSRYELLERGGACLGLGGLAWAGFG
jgi:hypothetical protein